MMPVGSKWELYIPYNLAYGERGAGRDIAPYSTLIFTMELKGIQEKNDESLAADSKTAQKTANAASKDAKKTPAKPVVKKAAKKAAAKKH